jgi:hypothetical protein
MKRIQVGALALALATVLGKPAGGQPIPPIPDPPIPPHAKDRFCVAECRLDARNCTAAARQEARMCAASCSDELQAAAEACGADPASEACQTARQAAQACLVPCGEGNRNATAACRTELRTCAAQCPQAEPPANPEGKDPQCVAECVMTMRSCLTNAREGTDCMDNCSGLIQTAQETCATGEDSEACLLARQAAVECLRTCRDTLRQTRQGCVRIGDGCVRSCADAESPGPPNGP